MNLSNAELKRSYNLKHFSVAANKYDVATKLLSFGGDAKWKQKLFELLPELENPKCLDLATGTGDISFLLAKKYPKGEVCGVDLTPAMIEIAKRRNVHSNVSFEVADIASLPIKTDSLDLVTGSYAIRNAPVLKDALLEIHRVLKQGGLALFLDFSKPDSVLAQKVQHTALQFWGSVCGLLLHANPSIHGYISKSLKAYPPRSELHSLLDECSLKLLNSVPLLGGWLEINVVSKR